MRLRSAAAAFLVLALAAGCGSESDSGKSGQTAQPKAASGAAAPGAGPDAAKAQAGPAASAAVLPAEPAIDPAEIARVAALDPDEAIGRYRQECNARDNSPRCRALRRRVEYLFLDALVSLRAAGEVLDPRLYRVAARAENPRLAIVGLRGLILESEATSAEDQQVILAALDSPYAGVRRTVLTLAAGKPFVSSVLPRAAAETDRSSSLDFLDESRSREPDPAMAGSYPGARYRYFASNATRHWFTTPDPPEKVIAFLTRDGKQALTADAFKAKTAADFQQAYMNAAMSGDEKKIAQAMQQMAASAGVDWTSALQNVSGAGEIRYIALAPDHVIAVFADEILRATSIVAPMPLSAQQALGYDPLQLQNEKAVEELQKALERENRVRQILGR